MRYSLHLSCDDWGAIRAALKYAGRDDVLARMDQEPLCSFCKLHPDSERDRAITSFCEKVGALVETELSQKI